MRSLIILEVEHDEDTDDLTGFVDYVSNLPTDHKILVKDYTVRVDLPACFELGE